MCLLKWFVFVVCTFNHCKACVKVCIKSSLAAGAAAVHFETLLQATSNGKKKETRSQPVRKGEEIKEEK